METLQQELDSEGVNAQIVAVNAVTALDFQTNLSDTTTYPLLQDTEEVDAFGQQGGVKDTVYVYDQNLLLVAYFPTGGPTLDLAKPEDFALLKQVVVETAAP